MEDLSVEELASNLSTYKDQLLEVYSPTSLLDLVCPLPSREGLSLPLAPEVSSMSLRSSGRLVCE